MKIKLFVLVLCHPCHHIPFYKFLLASIIYLFTLEAHSVVLISKQCNFSSSSLIECCFGVNPTLCVNDIYLFIFCLIFYWFFNDFNLWWWNTLTYLLLLKFLLLLSCDISLNPGPNHGQTTVDDDWKLFNKRGLHFLHIIKGIGGGGGRKKFNLVYFVIIWFPYLSSFQKGLNQLPILSGWCFMSLYAKGGIAK